MPYNDEEKKHEYNKQYYAAHKDALIDYQIKYRVAHKQELVDRDKVYSENHKEEKATYNREYRDKNKDQITKQRSNARLLRKYDLTTEEKREMVEKQGSLCGLCKRKRKLFVDHDHVTDEVRGLLCHRCNTALGGLGDNREGLIAALRYVETPRWQWHQFSDLPA